MAEPRRESKKKQKVKDVKSKRCKIKIINKHYKIMAP
jgi:hypothetical protein